MLEDRPILDTIITEIGKAHPLTESDVGEFKFLKAPFMKFHIEAYEAEGLGHVSLMSMNAFFGLMKMDTVIINPTEKDLPLLSYDRVYAMGKDTLIVELYNTMTSACDLSRLDSVAADSDKYPQNDLGEHWYDNIKLSQSISLKAGRDFTSVFDRVAEKEITAYLSTEASADFDRAEKHSKTCDYVEGLLQNGGPSTSVFQKLFGKEKTARLFREVLFGASR